jgi:hypothetical protein
MRRSLYSSLLALALIAAARTPAQADGRAGDPVKPAGQGPNPSWVEVGYGETPAGAQQMALNVAAESAVHFLREHHPHLGWIPSQAFLRERGIVRPEGEVEEKTIRDQKVQVAHARVEITEQSLREIRDRAREERKAQRQQLKVQRHGATGKALGGVVALLVVIAGYLRLEEATRGYYTRLLRATALALLLLVGAGLFLLR